VRALMARGASILKGFPGEVSERGGRVCVAVAAGTKIVGGVVLGTTPGGGMAFVEPPQVGRAPLAGDRGNGGRGPCVDCVGRVPRPFLGCAFEPRPSTLPVPRSPKGHGHSNPSLKPN
jgi:hypothetical protein